MKKTPLVLLTFVATLVVPLAFANVRGADRKLETALSHLYPADDPQFLRSMGLLMGPAILQGNELRELINGDQIFPAMLEAIRAWGELLQAGAEMYEYQPTMYHCKVMIVDGVMTSKGSTNFDVRSCRLNDEANLNVYDAALRATRAANLRSRPEAVAASELRGLEEAALARKAARPDCRAARAVALDTPPC